MQFRLDIPDPAPAVRTLHRELVALRERITRTAARRALERVVASTPVDTGRLRAAWGRGLGELGGSAPLESHGVDAAAISEGERLGTVLVRDAVGETEIEITNAVPYAALIEYGDAEHAGERTVERAVRETAAEIRSGIV